MPAIKLHFEGQDSAAATATVEALLAEQFGQAPRRVSCPPPSSEDRRGVSLAVIALVLSLPGATYLLLLDRLSKLHYSVAVTVLVLIGSNLIQLIVLELPMLAFAVWPEQTPKAIDSVKAWFNTHGREYGAAALAVIGGALAVRGVTGAW